MSFSVFFFLVLAIFLAKFFLIFGLSYYYFWILKPQWIEKYRIQVKARSQSLPMFELKNSIISTIISGFIISSILYFSNWGQVAFNGNQIALFKIYNAWDGNFWITETLGIFFIIIYYDAYFYFTHRLLHTNWLYKNVHVTHHRSLNPTPLASYSFHPIEGLINIFYLVPFFLFVPLHIYTFCILIFLADIGNWTGHVGFDFVPRFMTKSFLALTTPTHHNLHHQVSKANFGLYWGGWDKIFKTWHPDTEKEFLRVKNQ